MNNVKELMKEIEKSRSEMIQLIASKSYIDEEVVKVSKELDILIDQYFCFFSEK
jgi:glycine/serine hydroxymethyltransferase